MTYRPKIVLFLCLCVSFVSVSGECTAASQEDSGAMQRFTVSTVKELNDAIGSNREILLEPGDYILDDVVERDRYVTKWNGMRINFEFVENLTLTGLQGEKPVRFIFQGQKACSLRIFASKHVRIDNVVIEQSHCIEETLHIFHSSDISISNSIIQGSLGILHVSGSSAVTIDRTELQGSKRWGLRLQKVKGFHFVHSSISNCLAEVMVLHESTQIAFDHARFFNNHQQTGWKELFRLSGDSDVSYSNCDIQGNSTNVDKRSDYTLFGVYGNAEASLRNSRIRKNSADYFLRPGEQALQETGSTFEANAFRNGTLAIADCVVISGVPWDSFRVLRFPIVEVQGDYLKIVYDSLWDWRVWINIVEISAVFASDDEYSANRIESELYFTDPIVPVPIDIFSLSLNENRKLYHSPDESADFSIISPASKTLRNIENQGRDYLYALYFHQIRNGFAELWLDHGKDFEPEQLGWIKIVDESYHCFAHYFPEKRAGFLANIFFLADAQETRKLYQAPDDQASFRLLVPDGAPVSRRMHVARIHNGFALLAEFDYCFTDTLRPLGWIKIRDKDHRLLIWPVAPWLCT